MLAQQSNFDVTLGDVLTLIGFTFTIISLIFAAREIRRNTLVQRTQFLLDFTERYFGDVEVRNFFYKIDHNEFRYESMSKDEGRWLDSLLYSFDVIGHMVRIGAVTLGDVSIIAFQTHRVLGNSEVGKYLRYLDTVYEGEGNLGPAHKDARHLMHVMKTSVHSKKKKTG